MGKDARHYACSMVLLTGEDIQLDVSHKMYGSDIMALVCERQGIAESDFFGLKYKAGCDGQFTWLEHSKKVLKQLKGQGLQLHFSVRFYPPTTANLQDEITRYQFVLHIRSELLSGRLICAMPIHALLASFIVQGEFGRYDAMTQEDSYRNGMEFMPQQPSPFLKAVEEFHKKHGELSPAECDFQFLENARKIPLFGMEMYTAKDSENVEITVGFSSFGIIVLQHGRQVSRFSWPCIQKIYYSGKKFLLKVRSVDEVEYEDVIVVFTCDTLVNRRRIFKAAVEHHMFFCAKSFKQSYVTKTAFKFHSKVRRSQRKTFHEKVKDGKAHSTAPVTRLPSKTVSAKFKDVRRTVDN